MAVEQVYSTGFQPRISWRLTEDCEQVQLVPRHGQLPASARRGNILSLSQSMKGHLLLMCALFAGSHLCADSVCPRQEVIGTEYLLPGVFFYFITDRSASVFAKIQGSRVRCIVYIGAGTHVGQVSFCDLV